jgi:hypothetical protein
LFRETNDDRMRTIGEWLDLYKLYNKVYLKAIVSGVVFILLFY